ncbi:MAG: T9SS type A sorting domain-containing protein [Bacteroidales bacterium]|nr:T9SS type A sorting domain-containing protein [Bacteroidales bacterium]
MKKVLSFLFLATCMTLAHAQSLTVKIDGVNINNGDTVTIKASGYDDVLPDGTPYHEAQLDPIIHNNTPATINIRINMEKMNNTTSYVTQVCAGGSCVPDTISVPMNINSFSDLTGSFIHFAVPDNAEEGLFRMNIDDQNNENNNIDIYVRVLNALVGIERPTFDASLQAYPNPTASDVTISYAMEATQGVLQLTDMSGRIVMTQQLSASEGHATLNVAPLAAGVYFYGIKANGMASTTKKLIVK